jgi:glycerophosphoryl diester phosphodiesterase
MIFELSIFKPNIATFLIVAISLANGCTVTNFDLQGHRGARGHFPENTLEGFERALAMGVNTLELDIGITRDNVVVIGHDRRLNAEITRDTNGAWIAAPGPLISTLNHDEIRRFDVGRINPTSEYARRFPTQSPIDGARIPRLSELFALTERLGARHVRFNIETKIDPEQAQDTVAPEPFARALIHEIRRAGMAARATVQSFDWRTLAIVQREAPDIVTVYLTSEQPTFDTIRRTQGHSPWTATVAFRDYSSVPRMVHAAGGRVWSPHSGDIDEMAVAEAHRLGIRVIVWTLNDPPEIERLLNLGVDGIISDYPDRVRTAMAKRGLPLPATTTRAN